MNASGFRPRASVSQDLVAQQVERLTELRKIWGSNPQAIAGIGCHLVSAIICLMGSHRICDPGCCSKSLSLGLRISRCTRQQNAIHVVPKGYRFRNKEANRHEIPGCPNKIMTLYLLAPSEIASEYYETSDQLGMFDFTEGSTK